MNHQKVKRFIFSWYLAVPCAGVVFAMFLLLGHGFVNEIGEVAMTAAIAVLGGCAAFAYFVQQQKLAETTFFHASFSQFNKRYDRLNDHLKKLGKYASLSQKERDGLDLKVIDYFNLCAEEYLLYREGYILHDVWESWTRGMAHYWNIPRVNEMWKNEMEEGNSYYDFVPSEHFEVKEVLLPSDVSKVA